MGGPGGVMVAGSPRLAAAGWVLAAFALGLVVGAATFFLDTLGLAVVVGLAVLVGGLVWASRPQHTDLLWVFFAASFASLPFSNLRFAVGPLAVPMPTFFSAVAIAATCARYVVGRHQAIETEDGRPKWNVLDERGILLALGLILFGKVISLLWASYAEFGLWLTVKWCYDSMLFAFLMSLRNREWHRRIVLTLVLVTGALSVYGVTDYIINETYDVNFYDASIGTRAATGLHIAAVLPLALGVSGVQGLPLLARVLVWGSVAASATALVFTYVRGGWLAVLAALLFMGLFRRGVGLLWLCILGFSLVYLTHLGPTEVQERFWSVFSTEEHPEDPSVTNALRIELQSAAIREIIKHPILGTGAGNYMLTLPWHRYNLPWASQPHNFYLITWAEGGVFAWVGLMLLLFFLLRHVWRGLQGAAGTAGESLLRGALASLVSLCVFVLFSDDFDNIVVWTVLGLAVSGARLWGVPDARPTAPDVEDTDLVRRPS